MRRGHPPVMAGPVIPTLICNSYAHTGSGAFLEDTTTRSDSGTYNFASNGMSVARPAEEGEALMRRLTILVALFVALAASTSEATKPSAKGPAGGKPTVQTQKGGATKPNTAKASAPKGSTAKGPGQSGSKAVKPAKTTTQHAKGGGQTTVSGTKADKSVARADARTAKAEAKSTTEPTRTLTSPTGTTTTTPAVDFTATKVGQLLEKNSTLRSKIEAKLQAAGYTGTAYEAGYGFKNVGQLNAATNQVQNNPGTSFDVLKVLMTGTYVDPVTHNVYRTQKLPDGTTQLVKPELATNTPSTQSLGQAKQSLAGGAVMPVIVPYTTTTTTTTTTTGTPTTTGGSLTTTTTTSKSKSKPGKTSGTTTTSGSGRF